MLSPEIVQQLASPELKNYRPVRYQGDNMSIAFHDLHPTDQVTIRRLYDTLTALMFLLRNKNFTFETQAQVLAELAESPEWNALITEIKYIGVHISPAGRTDSVFAQAVHDIRGSAFASLVGRVEFFQHGLYSEKHVANMGLLVRDHLKIMRNALRGLDDVARNVDSTYKPHSIRTVVEKWYSGDAIIGARKVEVIFDCRYQGEIAERCLEVAALDRVLYNLLNNAARHTADSTVYLTILPIPEQGPRNIRFAVANAMTAEDYARLLALSDYQPDRLFEGGLSVTESGLGIRICADIVSHAYGLSSIQHAIKGGYVGVNVHDQSFIIWFHWPVAGE